MSQKSSGSPSSPGGLLPPPLVSRMMAWVTTTGDPMSQLTLSPLDISSTQAVIRIHPSDPMGYMRAPKVIGLTPNVSWEISTSTSAPPFKFKETQTVPIVNSLVATYLIIISKYFFYFLCEN